MMFAAVSDERRKGDGMISEGKGRTMPEKNDMGKCCGTCEFYKRDDEDMYGGRYCNNYDSDSFGDSVQWWYGVSCADYEERD